MDRISNLRDSASTSDLEAPAGIEARPDSSGYLHAKVGRTPNGVDFEAGAAQTRIILFTLFDDAIGKAVAAAAVGVDLVLSKTDGMEKLLESVQTVLKRNASPQSVLSAQWLGRR